MDGVVEIITGRERRRRWSLKDKLRLVAEASEPGAMIRAVAARHGVSESLLFTWRRQARQGLLVQAQDHPVFVPVQMVGPTGTVVAPLDERAYSAPAVGGRRILRRSCVRIVPSLACWLVAEPCAMGTRPAMGHHPPGNPGESEGG